MFWATNCWLKSIITSAAKTFRFIGYEATSLMGPPHFIAPTDEQTCWTRTIRHENLLNIFQCRGEKDSSIHTPRPVVATVTNKRTGCWLLQLSKCCAFQAPPLALLSIAYLLPQPFALINYPAGHDDSADNREREKRRKSIASATKTTKKKGKHEIKEKEEK